MTAQQLKNSILQLAVQGKLVPQDKNDEPASVLLERIKSEKQALIKAGKIKKDKPLAPITEEEIPFDIPESWKWCRLSDLAIKEIKRGKSPVYADNGSVLVFAQKCNVKSGGIDISLAKYLSDTVISKYPQEEYMQDNDIIVNSTGTGTLGRIGLYSSNDNPNNMPLVPDSHVTIVRVGKDSSRYIYYILKWYQPSLEEAGEGSTKQKELKADKIKELYIPIPPLSEQNRIVAKIEELIPYIEKYDIAGTKLTELNTKFPDALKKSILQEAVQGKLVPQNPNDEPASVLLEHIQAEKQKLIKEGKIKKEKPLAPITEEEIPFDIPESWQWVHLQEICSLIADVDHKMPKAVPKSEGKLFLSAKDLLDDGTINYTQNVKYISQEDFDRLSKKAKPILNDIIYSRIGAALGKARVVDSDREFIVSYSCCVIRTLIDEKYLRYYLESPFILKHSVLARQSIGVPDLGMGEIKQYLVALPPLEEQKRIVAKIEELMPIINTITK